MESANTFSLYLKFIQGLRLGVNLTLNCDRDVFEMTKDRHRSKALYCISEGPHKRRSAYVVCMCVVLVLDLVFRQRSEHKPFSVH